MKIFILSFLGSLFGVFTAFICLYFFKNFLERGMENHRFYKFKITPETKIETYKIELDKIIDEFIKKSRDTFDYSENRLLQKLCVDLFYLKAILTAEEREEIVGDIMLNENSEYDVDNEMQYFTKLTNKYMDRIEEYRNNQLKNDFNKIKNNWN